MIKKDDLIIHKKNKIIDVLYENEVIFRCHKIEDIKFDEILSEINKIEEKFDEKNIKFKKFMIILWLGWKDKSYKHNYLLDRIIIEDKECLDFIWNLNKTLLDDFLALAAANDVNYKQYKWQRLLKKWLFFLIVSISLSFLNVNLIWIWILFILFILTEPVLFIKILTILIKIKENL